MKKMIILALGIMFLFSVTAVSITTIIDKDYGEVIDSINDEPLNYTDIVCENDYCYIKLFKGNYSLGKIVADRYKCQEYSEAETAEDPIECTKWKEEDIDKIYAKLEKSAEKSMKQIEKAITNRLS